MCIIVNYTIPLQKESSSTDIPSKTQSLVPSQTVLYDKQLAPHGYSVGEHSEFKNKLA